MSIGRGRISRGPVLSSSRHGTRPRRAAGGPPRGLASSPALPALFREPRAPSSASQQRQRSGQPAYHGLERLAFLIAQFRTVRAQKYEQVRRPPCWRGSVSRIGSPGVSRRCPRPPPPAVGEVFADDHACSPARSPGGDEPALHARSFGAAVRMSPLIERFALGSPEQKDRRHHRLDVGQFLHRGSFLGVHEANRHEPRGRSRRRNASISRSRRALLISPLISMFRGGSFEVEVSLPTDHDPPEHVLLADLLDDEFLHPRRPTGSL